MAQIRAKYAKTAIAVTAGTDSANAAGTTDNLSRADHVHKITLATTEVTATANATTTSTTDVLITTMTITPIAGDYLILFSASIDHSTAGATVTTSLYFGGTLITASVRPAIPFPNGLSIGGTSLPTPIAIQSKVTVNGSQAIEARWKVSSGTGTIHQRTLTIIQIN